MKILSSILLFAALAFVRASAQSADDAKERQWNVTAECQMIVLPQKAALPLLPALLDEAKAESGFQKLKQMIDQGDAELASHLVGRFRDGEPSFSASVEEFRYATEFEPPRITDKTSPNLAAIGITPTSFETRNIGTSLETEVRVHSSGERLQIKVTPRHVRFLRWTRIDVGKLPNGENLFVQQPVFHTMTNTSSLTVRNGQRMLIGAHQIPGTDKMEFFLVRVAAKRAAAK